ncbi:DMT family transporter [Halostella sp. PRR32]|uniref:DMT family transporter n=1 Tax=Halostella sp. PRR32 TaxID=3098147 RepID=UPI002B1E3DEB|nr:DMT family transporter [Halostella sp. PRR32]
MSYRQYYPIVAGVLWGTAYPSLQVLLGPFTPAEVVLFRVVLGTLFLGGVLAVIYGREPFIVERAHLLPLTVLGWTSVALFYLLQTVAVQHSTPVNVSFIISTYPIFVSVVAPLLLATRLRLADGIGLTLALTGVYVIVGNGRIIDLFSSPTFVGDLLALAGSLSFMCYLLLTRYWNGRFDLDYLSVTFFAHFLSIPPLVVFFLTREEFVRPTPSLSSVLVLCYLAIVVTGGGLLLLNAGLEQATAPVAALRLLVIPLVSTLLSVALLDEVLTVPKMLGGAAIGVGIVLQSVLTDG